MPKVSVHYVLINGGDGSANVGFYADAQAAQLATDVEETREPLNENGPYAKVLEFDSAGRLLNPSMSKAELLSELAELRGEEEEGETAEEAEQPAEAFNAAAADPDATYTATLYYIVRNNGDGSASARFLSDAECAQLASDLEDEGGEAFGDNPHRQTLKFNGRGLLLNPDATTDELRQELAERNGEDEEAEMEAKESVAATPAAAPPIDSVAGKTVVFTGRLSTMTRKQAESAAIVLGAHVTDSVTRNTDILVAGEDAGAKLAKAKSLGITVLTEAEWNKLAQGKSPARKPGGPGF